MSVSEGEAVEAIIEKHSNPDDANVFTDGSVQREVPTKAGWGLYVRINGANQDRMGTVRQD